MSDSIRLSPEHGVNPSVTVCFWCGIDMGVALFGRIGNDDEEAPRRVVIDYEPCDECKKNRTQGFTFIEAVRGQDTNDKMPIGFDEEENPVYPTGRFIIITLDAAKRILQPEHIGGQNIALVDRELFEELQPKEETDEDGQ